MTTYQRCSQVLEAELGIPPSVETTTLYEAIKAGHGRGVAEQAREISGEKQHLLSVDRYLRQDLLATGGHGEVYHGQDIETGQAIVIKRLKPDLVRDYPEFVQRFKREGEMLRQLDHPNIVKVLATFEQAEQYNIVMDFVPGGSLRELLDQEADLAPGSYSRNWSGTG